MPLRYDMNGNLRGYIAEGTPAPEGEWIRPDYSSDFMAPVDFLDRIGQERFDAIWTAALANSQIAFTMMRGFAAQTIQIKESFPVLLQMESLGLLPAGTAMEIWG